MAVRYGRYTITSPGTSKEVVDSLRAAIDDGSRVVPLEVTDAQTHETETITFMLTQSRYGHMNVEYLGKLADGSAATIVALTHTDLNDTPAQMTYVRQTTP